MPDYDLIIVGGTVVDGLRTPRFLADLGIKNGKVAHMGDLKTATAQRKVDASGAIVAPGFVDLHTHYDAQIFWDPHCSVSSWHGVTSIAIGNCGFGFAPCSVDRRDRAMRAMTRNEAIPYEAMKIGMKWDWVTFPDFLDSIQRMPKAVNVVSSVPLTPIYTWVMGWDQAKLRRPTEQELQEMCRLVREGMDAGAVGWSAQVLGPDSVQRDYDASPMVTDLMPDEEILRFARILRDKNEGYIELAYQGTGEENRMIDRSTTDLFEKVAAESQRPVLYQAVVANIDNLNQHRQRLQWLERCNSKGLRVFGQADIRRTPFQLTFEDWNLFDQSPTWRMVTLGSPAERKTKMQNPQLRAAMRAEWDAGVKPEGAIRGSVAGLIIERVQNPSLEKYVGLSVANIAKLESKHVVDALLDIVVADDLRTEIIGPKGRDSAEGAAEILNSPYCVAGLSDGGAHVKFSPGGVFTTEILAWLVRDEQLVSLEEAHHKLSYLPAIVGGIRDRGFIQVGAPADIVVYDLQELQAGPVKVVRDLPGGDWRRIQEPKGYRWILVNGEITIANGRPTRKMPGRLLRHGVAA